MNERRDRHDGHHEHDDGDPSIDRFGSQLRAIASDVPLRPGSELATVRTAHRRRHRRRNLTAAATVVAVAGGTTVAIQQLGKTSPDTVGTADQPGGGGADVVLAPAAPATTAAPPAATSVPADPYDAITDQVVPAQATESNYVWNVVTPDAANAVYGRFDGTVPGVIVATAPGRAETPAPPERALYYTDDGIRYEHLDAAPPSGLLHSVVADGDRIYNVGTAPGTAATDANPVIVELSADRGTTWERVDLPIDTNAGSDVPMIADHWSVSATPFDGGAIVLAQHRTSLDLSEVPDAPEVHNGYTREGLRVPEAGCTPATAVPTTAAAAADSTTTTVNATTEDESGPTLASGTAPPTTQPDGSCDGRLVTWDELGVPSATVDAMFDHQTRVFRVVDGVATEVSLPDGVDMLQPAGVSPHDATTRFTGYDMARDGWGSEQEVGFFEITPEGDLAALLDTGSDDLLRGYSRHATSTHEFVDVGPAPGSGSILASTGDGQNWTFADTDALYGELEYPSHVIAAASDDVYVAGAMVWRDVIAEQGGVSIEVDGLVLERISSRGDIRVTDAASGEALTDAVQIEDIPGSDGTRVIVRSLDDGTVLTEIPMTDLDSLYEGAQYDEAPRWMIETTADGVHIATESVAELLGVDDADVSSISRITTVGRQVIVAVTLHDENPDGTKVQKVLVGTPEA